jgi:hypothetical protein
MLVPKRFPLQNEITQAGHLLDFGREDQEFQPTEVPIIFSSDQEQFPAASMDVQIGAVKLSLPIDTGHGLGCILLSPAVLSSLEVQYTGRTHENYDAFGKRYESREYRLPNLRIGDLAFTQVTGFELFTRWGTPGLIGLPFLRHFNVLIDYPNRRFGLYQQPTLPGTLTSPGWIRVKLVSPGAGLVLPVTFSHYGETYHFCLDTGSTDLDHGQHYNLINARSPLGKRLRQEGALEPPTDAETLGKLRSDQFRTVSGVALTRLDFVLVDMEYLQMDGFFGHNFFLHYSVFIDFSAEEIYLKPVETRS